MCYTEQFMPQLREAKQLLSHDKHLVCPLSVTSPSRFQRLSSVSGLKEEVNDLFLALLICLCQMKHFQCFPPQRPNKYLFQKNLKFGEQLLLPLSKNDTIFLLLFFLFFVTGIVTFSYSCLLMQYKFIPVYLS